MGAKRKHDGAHCGDTSEGWGKETSYEMGKREGRNCSIKGRRVLHNEPREECSDWEYIPKSDYVTGCHFQKLRKSGGRQYKSEGRVGRRESYKRAINAPGRWASNVTVSKR